VPTPVNRTLVAGIKGIEYRMTHAAGKAQPPGVGQLTETIEMLCRGAGKNDHETDQ
jgi:hypothetical protein